MKPLLLLAVSVLAVPAAACAPHRPAARAALDCPETQGRLTRSSIAPDGKTCLYATRDGDEVSLRLIPVTTGVQAALDPIEQELQAEAPPTPPSAPPAAEQAAKNAKTAAKDAEAAAKAAGAQAGDAERAAREAQEDAAKDTEDDGPSHRNGEHTHIDLPGIHISADDDNANVNVGMVHVNAGDNGAVVRMSRDVRMRGEALSREKRGFMATYILAQDNLKDGYKAVGYEAGGPRVGPITVAVVKSKTGERHDIFDDVKRLVRRNSGT